MFKEITRSKLIQIWFVAVALAVAGAVVFGPRVSLSTGVLIVTMCLVPPAILMMLWPGAQPQTIGEVLRGDRPRG